MYLNYIMYKQIKAVSNYLLIYVELSVLFGYCKILTGQNNMAVCSVSEKLIGTLGCFGRPED